MSYLAAQRIVADEIASTLATVDATAVDELLASIRRADRVFFVGVGRVKLALEAIAKRLAHLGIDTVMVGQITEPAITDADLLIVGSGSGESAIPLAIAAKARSFGSAVAHIGSNPESSMRQHASVFVRIPVQTKLALPGEVPSQQPMTSLFEQCLLLLGDSLALMLIDDIGADLHGLWRHHANLE
ncbi:6-phospho-3-hexuloisomerase [Microbacterium gubbeenense]|uniref:6-phospho-3-hexuloisomerase n=1 Tax=Microbacterium gubbeenense TaxID=159896 RepID=UPI00041EDC52|nr:6-phospho-3-hexuloisomerase [Microbacterium gubbeenense]